MESVDRKNSKVATIPAKVLVNLKVTDLNAMVQLRKKQPPRTHNEKQLHKQ